MADQANMASLLAALGAAAAQRAGGGPLQGSFQPPAGISPTAVAQAYPTAIHSPAPSGSLANVELPKPVRSGVIDLSGSEQVSSGSVSIAEAIAKARGIAAEKGISYESRDGGKAASASRDADPRPAGRSHQRSRSRSRSPPSRRDNYRDNYNPYREERREDRRDAGGREYGRERSYSPGMRDRRGGGGGGSSTYSPPPSRGHGGRGERSPPRGTSNDEISEIMQIDSSLVGLIIGRQGENLRRVETETGARVQFVTGPESSGPSRGCRISGSRQARVDARNEINRIIEENGRQVGVQPERRSGGTHQPTLRDGEASVQIMVPDRTVGLIIGRGGETIRDLQERSRCHVNIVGETKSIGGLRPVNLIGTHESAAKAKELILEIVDSDTKGQASLRAEASRSAGGYVGPSGGGGGGVGGGGGDRQTDTIRVPSDAVGMIIGKGGETIKEMQNMSGCKINVSPSSGPLEVEREVGLIGTRESIENAKRTIEEKVDAVRLGNRSGGGGGGGASYMGDPYNDRQAHGGPSSLSPRPAASGSYGGQTASNETSSMQGNYAGPTAATGGGAPAGDASTGASGETDPYAAYGGYNNYVAMWYAAMAQQQQQQQQNPQQDAQRRDHSQQYQQQQLHQQYGQGEQPRPPGT